MKKINNNNFARSFKWTFLTLMLTFLTYGEIFAQNQDDDKQLKDEIGRAVYERVSEHLKNNPIQGWQEKKVLSRQDSISVLYICRPDLYKNITDLFDLNKEFEYVLKEYKRGIDSIIIQKNAEYTSADIELFYEYGDLIEKVIQSIKQNDSIISKTLTFCFNNYVLDPTFLKVFHVKNEPEPEGIIIQGTIMTIGNKETYFIEPDNKLGKKILIYFGKER